MKLSDDAKGLTKVEKKRYVEKLVMIQCSLDPYIS